MRQHPLAGFCHACARSKILPLGPLLARFGNEAIVGDVVPFLTCKMCGGKRMRIEAKF